MKNSFEHKYGFPTFSRLLFYFMIISGVGLLGYLFSDHQDHPDPLQNDPYELVRDRTEVGTFDLK